MLVVCVVCAGMCMCVLCCMLFVEACVYVCDVVCECVCSYACVHICCMLFVQACVHVCGVCVAHMLTLCVLCEQVCMGVLICMCTHIDHVDICGHVCCVCVVFVGVCACMFSSNRNVLKRNVFCASSRMYWWNRRVSCPPTIHPCLMVHQWMLVHSGYLCVVCAGMCSCVWCLTVRVVCAGMCSCVVSDCVCCMCRHVSVCGFVCESAYLCVV